MASKILERIFAEAASQRLGEEWQVIEIPEPLDFEVRAANSVFGLEVRQVFEDSEEKFGSPSKRLESERQRAVSSIARDYYDRGGPPARIQFLGELPSEITDLVGRLIKAAPKTEFTRITIRSADLEVFITRISDSFARYSRWVYVKDLVGWVGAATRETLQVAIDEKAKKLPSYQMKYQEIDLLLVADRTKNSGKLDYRESLTLRNPGFRRILFLAYPESIHLLA